MVAWLLFEYLQDRNLTAFQGRCFRSSAGYPTKESPGCVLQRPRGTRGRGGEPRLLFLCCCCLSNLAFGEGLPLPPRPEAAQVALFPSDQGLRTSAGSGAATGVQHVVGTWMSPPAALSSPWAPTLCQDHFCLSGLSSSQNVHAQYPHPFPSALC